MKSFSSAQLWKVSVSGGLSSRKDSYRFMRIHSVERLSLSAVKRFSVSGILKGKHKDSYRGMRIHTGEKLFFSCGKSSETNLCHEDSYR